MTSETNTAETTSFEINTTLAPWTVDNWFEEA